MRNRRETCPGLRQMGADLSVRGYFGAGLSVIMLAVLGSLLAETLTRIDALKSALGLSINVAAAVCFVLSGEITSAEALPWTTAAVPWLPPTTVGSSVTRVKRTAEFHGGRIWVEATGVPGEGARFCLTLEHTSRK